MKYVVEGTKQSAYFDNTKSWYLLGIVSFGECGDGKPGIFTNPILFCLSQTNLVKLRPILYCFVLHLPGNNFDLLALLDWRVLWAGSNRPLWIEKGAASKTSA